MRKVLATVVLLAAPAACAQGERATLGPFGNEEFWRLSTTLSEPAGSFDQTDNFVSNEALYAQLAQMLRRRDGAYIGVGPEQNFSYIARLRPTVAFIIDIREENRHLHLMYKALFELTANRADFVARLFSRRRPPDLTATTSVGEMFAAFAAVKPDGQFFDETSALVRRHLLDTRALPLRPSELTSIHETLNAFYTDGPAIRYGRSLPPSKTRPSYHALMTVADLRGNSQSYLASEESFTYLKELHARNHLVPVVGDFAGPDAIREVGDFLHGRQLLVSAFYASNVEVYLTRDQRRTFCASLAALPFDDATYFIENRRLLTMPEKLDGCARISPSLRWP
jgi:hypothetical protein